MLGHASRAPCQSPSCSGSRLRKWMARGLHLWPLRLWPLAEENLFVNLSGPHLSTARSHTFRPKTFKLPLLLPSVSYTHLSANLILSEHFLPVTALPPKDWDYRCVPSCRVIPHSYLPALSSLLCHTRQSIASFPDFFFLILWDWGLNSGLNTSKAGALLLGLCLQSILIWLFLEMSP
jgi:hypothetical protein